MAESELIRRVARYRKVDRSRADEIWPGVRDTLRQVRVALVAAEELREAYVEASVSDEEGLLASVAPGEQREMWDRVDRAAEALKITLGIALGARVE